MLTRTVYALYWPETHACVEALWGSRPHAMYERAYEKHQDALHLEFLSTWRAWNGLGLGDAFPHAYPTSGASEVLKDLILPPGKLHLFDGDYEGYAAIARDRGMEVVAHPRTLDAARADFGPHDQFWISNPSAIDGCIWPDFDAFVEALAGHAPQVRVFLDVTYVGATKVRVTLEPARHANIAAVAFSLSKPFGVYYHRIGGCVSRAPIATLWPNLWFKNLFSLRLGTELMKRYAVTELPERHAALQATVLERAKGTGRAPQSAVASDVVILAHSPEGADEFRRSPGHHRYCLTEGMDKHLRGESP